MDLSKLSDADLNALASGDMSKLSNEGLTYLSSGSPIVAPTQEPVDNRGITRKYLIDPLNEIAGSVVEPALKIGTSMIAKPVSEIAGMAAVGKEMVSPSGGDPEAYKQYVQNQLTYQPRTQLGSSELNPLNAIPTAIGNIVGGAADVMTSGMEESPWKSGAKEALMQGAGLVGVKGGSVLGATTREANLAKFNALKEQKALDAMKSDIRKKGQELGLIAPAEGTVAEVVSRHGKVDPHLAIKNTETATNKLAESVGLKKGAISDMDIDARVKELGDSYAVVEKALPKQVSVTPEFQKSVLDILAPMKEKYLQDPKTFSGYTDAIGLLEQQLRQKTITPSIMMDKIKQLRSDARIYDKNPSGTPLQAELAASSYKLANIYEDLIDSTLGDKKAIADKFRDSRKQLAQIHVINSARMDSGLIDMQKLASNVGKYAENQKFTTGTISDIAKFANTYKQVSKPTGAHELPSSTPWELVAATGGVGAALPTGGLSLLGMYPVAAKAVFPAMAKKGMLQGSPKSYDIPTIRKAKQNVYKGGLMGTAISPYTEENQ